MCRHMEPIHNSVFLLTWCCNYYEPEEKRHFNIECAQVREMGQALFMAYLEMAMATVWT